MHDPRHHVCTRKHKYTEADARRIAARRSAASHSQIIAYPCPFGDHWHIGHPTQKDVKQEQ